MFFLRLSGLICLIQLIFIGTNTAQVADSLELPEIVIMEDPFLSVSSNSTTKITRIRLKDEQSLVNLSDILQQESSFFLRNQGLGLLSTISFNGFSPSQIRVEWNGMELTHPMVGLIDASLLPTAFISSIDYSSSYVTTSSGTMAMGGVIAVNSESKVSKPYVNYSFSNLYNHEVSANFPLGKKLSLKLITNQSSNEFEYYDPVFLENRTRKNNSVSSTGLLLNYNDLIFGKRLSSTVWVQHAERGIPGPIGTTVSEATQTDEWIRLSNSILLNSGKYPWKLQVNGALEKLDYLDSTLVRFGDDPLSYSTILRTQVRTTKRLLFLQKLWSDVTLERADLLVNTNNYENSKRRGISKFLLSSTLVVTEKLSFTQINQLEHFSDFGFAFSPSLGMNYQFIKDSFWIYSTLSNAFSPPSFNDLYWPRLGNPDLKAQSATKWESGYHWNNTFGNHSITHESSLLLASIKNGIQWIPNGANWYPDNVLAAEHTVINTSLNWKYSKKNWNLSSGLQASFTKAVIGEATEVNETEIGKQLIYVPDAMLGFYLETKRNNSMLRIDYQRVGNRYLNYSNTDWLDPYQTVNLQVYQKIITSAYNLTLGLTIENLLNEQYEIIRLYPIPGRVYRVSLKLNLN